MEDAAFRRDQMQEAVRRLGERLREVRRQEDQVRRRVAYDAALAERDALAAELAAVYPALAEQLADIVGRIAANDALIQRVNRKSLPDDAASIVNAEAVARGVSGNFVECGAGVPRLDEGPSTSRVPISEDWGRLFVARAGAAAGEPHVSLPCGVTESILGEIVCAADIWSARLADLLCATGGLMQCSKSSIIRSPRQRGRAAYQEHAGQAP
jgi:hypothetical protein